MPGTRVDGTRTDRSRTARTRVVGLVAAVAVVCGACVPGGGPTTIYGPVTVPLPPLGATPPPVTIPVLICNINYSPPSFAVQGATVTIPAITIDPSQSRVVVPGVVVKIPATKVGLPAIGLQCGPIDITTNVNLIIPATVSLQAAVIDFDTKVLTLVNPSFTINGVGLELPGLAGLVIPLPPITIPLSSIHVDLP